MSAVFVQKAGGEYINETAFSFAMGCRGLGLHVETFEKESLRHIRLSREACVHGYVSVVRDALSALGVEEPLPRVDGFPPEELLPFFGRRLWSSSLGEIRKQSLSGVFIKPLSEAKLFTGYVRGKSLREPPATAMLSDEFKVMCSDVIEFVSEYRLFVHKGVIVDCRRYAGDFSRLVDIDFALECVEAYKTAPVAYSLDLGVTRDGKTLIVEVNDAFSLGAYGMPSVPYAQMILDRWEQMVGLT